MPRHGSAETRADTPQAPLKVARGGGLASWPIRRKLAALVSLPLVVIVGAGGYVTKQAYDDTINAGRASTFAHLADLSSAVTTAFNAELVAAQNLTARTGSQAQFDQAQSATDAVYNQLLGALDVDAAGLSQATRNARLDVIKAHGKLPNLRASVRTLGSLLVGSYGNQQTPLRVLTTTLATDLSGSALDGATVEAATTFASLSNASAKFAEESVGIDSALTNGSYTDQQKASLVMLQASEGNLLTLANAHATPVQSTQITPLTDPPTQLVGYRQEVAKLPAPGAQTNAEENANKAKLFRGVALDRLRKYDVVLRGVAANAVDHAVQLRQSALLRTVIALSLAVASVAIVLLFAAGIARTVTGPMRRLRSGAVDAATVRLPAAVRQIEREGPDAAVAVPPVLPPEAAVGPEVREVAQALDGLTGEAIRLATSQVRLRQALDEAFVSMSRRSQSMVEKQLAIIDELESTEEDPEQLRNLFRLDHLAARMRRYNDNLLVLAGSSVRTRSAAPVPISDVFRAATSEMEQYERVRLQPLSGASVAGAAAGGLIHLLAELLDNAAMYSPPTSPIVLAASFTPDGGLHLEVTDSGVGIPAAELADLNARLAMPGTIDTQVPSRMGLFVVARLAQRGGLAVRLSSRTGTSGTVAEVLVPTSLVMGAPSSPGATGTATSPEPPRLPAQLPSITPTPMRGIRRPAPRTNAPAETPPPATTTASGLPSRRPGAALAGNPLASGAAATPEAPAARAGAPGGPTERPVRSNGAAAGLQASRRLAAGDGDAARDAGGPGTGLPRRERGATPRPVPFSPPGATPTSGPGPFEPLPGRPGQTGPQAPSAPPAAAAAARAADLGPVRAPGQPGGGPAIGPSAATAAAAAAAARSRPVPAAPTSGLFAPTGPMVAGRPGDAAAGSAPRSGPGARPGAAAAAAAAAGAAARAAAQPSAAPSAPPSAPAAPPAAAQAPARPGPAQPAGTPAPLPVRPTRPAATGQGLGAPAPARQGTPVGAPAAQPASPMEAAARQAAAAAAARLRPLGPDGGMIGTPPSGADRGTTPIFDSISVWFSDDQTASAARPGEPARVIDLRDAPAGAPAGALAGAAGSVAGAAGAGAGASTKWAALGDQRWIATNARAASRPEIAGETGAGLPKRRPGANLLPSASAAAPSATPAPAPTRRTTDAESVRGRLGSYQRGLSSARRARHLPPEADSGGLFSAPTAGEPEAGRRSGGQGGDS